MASGATVDEVDATAPTCGLGTAFYHSCKGDVTLRDRAAPRRVPFGFVAKCRLLEAYAEHEQLIGRFLCNSCASAPTS